MGVDVTNSIRGPVEFATGVSGRCLVLDGLTTHIIQPAAQAPHFTDQFTVVTWLVLGAYPLNWSPLVDLYDPERCGFFFGVDAHGRLGLAMHAGERSQWLTTTNVIPLRQWHQVAGVLTANGELQLFLDGKLVGGKKLEGSFVPPRDLDLLVGRSRFKAKPEGAIRPDANAEIFAFLDGALDGLKIFKHALSGEELAAIFNVVTPSPAAPWPARILPVGPSGAFGAFYTQLKFYQQWDRAWRVSNFPDVVVRFDDLPIRFIFWRGTSYIPNWVTENGIWYNNEFNETWGGVRGCGEPMSDKQCRYSHVRVIESSAARAVVHWRYALTDVFYQIARQDEATGWGDWSDELYTIYPDGTSVRDVTLHSSNPEQPHEWQESIVVMGPGFSPENSLEPTGLTLVDAAGDKVDYTWGQSTPPRKPGKPAHPCIQLINTKSRYKPFAILRPEDKPEFDVYSGEVRREVSPYPWWNHWPAATFASDGRYAMAADRPSHSSLTHLFWGQYQAGPQWMRKIMLAGMTDQSAESLLPLMRAWSHPAELRPSGAGVASCGYDPTQKAYVLKCAQPGASLAFDLAANPESPVLNPAFVVLGWGATDAKLLLNGKEIPCGKDFRCGHRQTIDDQDLIVWLRMTATSPLNLQIIAK